MGFRAPRKPMYRRPVQTFVRRRHFVVAMSFNVIHELHNFAGCWQFYSLSNAAVSLALLYFAYKQKFLLHQ